MKRLLAVAAVLFLAACTSPAPKPAPTPLPTTSPAPTGVTPFGAHWDWNRYDAFQPYLRKLAGSATYHELTWCDIEKQQGQRDWAAVDQVATRTRDLGITLHLKIRVGVCWATGGTAQYTRGQANKTESAMPRDLAVYKGFVDAVVRRYQPYGVREYAIENEVNAPSYWAGSSADYTKLVETAAEAIRAADPKALVVDSGISSVAYGMGIADRLLKAGQQDQAKQAYQRYFQRRIGTRGQKIPADATAAMSVAENVRSLDFLAATEALLDRKVVNVRQVHFYEHWTAVPDLMGYLAAENPAGTPIEAWEVGQFWRTPTDDDDARAGEMVKAVTQLAAAGVREVIWLPLAYNPNNRQGSEVRYGLLDPNGTERVAGRMMAELATAAQGAVAQPVSDKGLRGVAFRRGGESTLVVWSDGAPVTVPGGSGVSGAEVGKPPSTGDLKVTATPVLLRAAKDPAAILASARSN
ncbi:hypothetical protein [Phytohabitans aurantiacus]|jgi:hypothetical protein|uniref:Glycoside hydrolase family 42 N-terminal domain-containing protein n=1 Tax=Phytohabitans aurantiacus TaxID=3016789 RepID=A0ABQ5R0S3_9ACTN|nr:hypothetical protein [Phytohabitans aurantiacus]GLI00285.1 hypothetical protein Pa4123_55610 [Phytohabitans aurantiacus]